MTASPDGTIAVRDGESIDVTALHAWLAAAAPSLVPSGATLSVRQFPAGFSNLTYLVRVETRQSSASYVLRRPPRGVTGGGAHDMAREHNILAALHPAGVPTPRPIAFCEDAGVLGAPFYVMEHVDGVILRGTAAPPLSADDAQRATRMRDLSSLFVRTLAMLHALPLADERLRMLGKPQGYVERQTQGWTRRWDASRTDEVPSLDAVASWLGANRPAEQPPALVHNDFKFDNLVLYPDLQQVRAILDWEMATVGDPLMDLGTSLAYWTQAGDAPVFRSLGIGVTALPGSATRAELVQMYADAAGRDVHDAPFYYVFGLFKVAVIAQQIYARHVKGLTADPRFAALGAVVQALGDAAERAAITRRV